MNIEIVLTAHRRWWLRLLNCLGARMKWTHALLLFYEDEPSDGYIVEAAKWGVVKRDWDPSEFEDYGQFQLKPEQFTGDLHRQYATAKMQYFALGEVGKRYKYEALGLIALRILRRIRRPRVGARLLGTGEVCTSLVDRTLLSVGFDLLPGEDSPFILPDEIARSQLLVWIHP